MNLNKLLNTNIVEINSAIIAASEDNAALVNYIETWLQSKLGARYNKKTYQADRYFNIAVIFDELNANSLFGDANFIIIRFKTKPSIEQAKLIEQAFELANSDNFILLVCDKLDKKDTAAAWVMAANLYVALSGDVDEARMWALHKFSSTGLQIEDDALEFILTMNYGNYTQLNQDIERISFLFVNHPQKINKDDVVAQLTDNAQYNIFALSAAYLNGDSDLSLKIFDNVCQATEDAILLMWTIGEDLRKLIQIKNELRNNPNIMTILPKLRIWGNATNSFQLANRRLTYSFLLNCLNDLAQIDTVIKGLKSGDGIFLLRQLIFNLTRGGRV